MENMKKKIKRIADYWKYMYPIWLHEIMSWFPEQKNKKLTVTSGVLFAGIATILYFSGKSHEILIDIQKSLITYVVFAVWALLLAVPSFMVADRKLRHSFEIILHKVEFSNKNN